MGAPTPVDSQKEFQDTQFLLGSAAVPWSKAEQLWNWSYSSEKSRIFHGNNDGETGDKPNNKFLLCHSDCRSSPVFHEIRGFARGAHGPHRYSRAPSLSPGTCEAPYFHFTQFPASQEPAEQPHGSTSIALFTVKTQENQQPGNSCSLTPTAHPKKL